MKKSNFLITVLVCIAMMMLVALPTFAGSKSTVSADVSYKQVTNTNRTEITGYNTAVVKQATYAIVWTEQELSEQQKIQKVNELIAANSSQHLGLNSVSKESYYFINDYGTFDLSSLKTQFGTYTFTKDEATGKSFAEAVNDKISHFVVGNGFVPVSSEASSETSSEASSETSSETSSEFIVVEDQSTPLSPGNDINKKTIEIQDDEIPMANLPVTGFSHKILLMAILLTGVISMYVIVTFASLKKHK